MNIKRLFILFTIVLLAACLPSKKLTPTGIVQTSQVATPTISSAFIKTSAVLTPLPTQRNVPIASTIPGLINLGMGQIAHCEYSPDGKRLGLVTTLGVYIYSSADLSLLDSLSESSSVAAFSPDWSYLAVGTGATVQLMRLADKKVEAQLETQQGSVISLLFSPDGSLLVSFVRPAGEEVYTSIIDLWRVSDGKLLDTWPAGDIPLGATFSPDGGTLFIWNRFGKGLRSFPILTDRSNPPRVPDQNLDSLAFSPDGKLLAKVLATDMGTTGDILIQQISDPGQVRKLPVGNQPEIGLLQFSPDSALLIAFFNDGKVQVWRVEDGTLLQTYDAVGQSMAVSPNGRTLVLTVADGLAFYNIDNGQLLEHLGNFLFRPDHAAISPQGDRLAALLDDRLAIWKLPDGQMIHIPPTAGAFSLAWSPDGVQLALGGSDGKVRLLQASDGSFLRTFAGHSYGVQGVAFSPDGTLLASSSMESLKIWQVRDGSLLKDFSIAGGWVDNLRFSHDGKYLAAWVANTGVEIWRLSDEERLTLIPESIIGNWNIVDYAQDLGFLAFGEETQVSLWHMNGDTPFQSLDIGKSRVTSLHISPEGSLLAVGLIDGTIELWKLPEGRLMHTFQGGNTSILSLDFSADGKSLLSVSSDGTIKFLAIQ